MITTRFAPSTTGYLHLGHVLHMLYVWGIARAKDGKIVARIEDHDLSRRCPEFEPAILSDMEWLGFSPDLGIAMGDTHTPYRQSDCSEIYEDMLGRLAEKNLIYGCECSRKEVREQQPEGLEELCYSGTCAKKNLPLEGHTVRFRCPEGEVVFHDLEWGECHQVPTEQCGDFSLRDRKGQWTYQFCCVCDDIRHGINLVIRGEDILASTARQIQLFQTFEQPVPRFFHHSLLCDITGTKLSKRQRSESISHLRETGVSAEELLGRAAFAGGLITEYAPLHVEQAPDLFKP